MLKTMNCQVGKKRPRQISSVLVLGGLYTGKSTLVKKLVNEGDFKIGYYLSDDLLHAPNNAVVFDSHNKQLTMDYIYMVTSIQTEYKRFMVIDDNIMLDDKRVMELCDEAGIMLYRISRYNIPCYENVYSFNATKEPYSAIISQNGVINGVHTYYGMSFATGC